MHCEEANFLAKEFKMITRELRHLPPPVQSERVTAWMSLVGESCAEYALTLVEIYEARDTLHVEQINLNQFIGGTNTVATEDNRISVGSAQNSVITGKIDRSTIAQMQNNIQPTGKLDDKGVELFRQAYGELEAEADEAKRQFIAKRLSELQSETSKSEPDKTMVESLVGGLKAFASVIPAIKKIADWASSLF